MATIREILQRRRDAKAEKERQEANKQAAKNKTTFQQVKVGSGGGTYYAGSGTYVDSSGQGYSVASVPSGASVSFSKDPNLSSGGRVVTTKSNISTINSTNQQLEAQRQAEANKQAELIRQAELQKAIQQKNLQRIAEINKQARDKLREEGLRVARLSEDALRVARRGADIVSGGRITQKDLTKRQTEINRDIELFNERFSGELSESELQRAKAEKERIEKGQKKLTQDLKDFEKSPLKIAGDIVYGKSTIDIKTTPKQINRAKKDLKNSEKKLAEAKTNVGKFFWSRRVEEAKETLELLNLGKARVGAYDPLPITPAAGVSAIGKISKIKFIGSQKINPNGKLITDLAFISDKGKTLGFARGVTLSKGKGGLTITKGLLGRPGFVLRTGKLKLTSQRLFTTVDKSYSKKLPFKLIKEVELLNNAKRTGKTVKITENIKKLIQTSVGKNIVIKGGKLSPKIGKSPKIISQDNFAAISSITKKGDWSRIVGGSITSKGAKAEFLGFIKGENTLSSTGSTVLKLQRQKALNKVVGAASSALAKVESSAKLSKLTKAEKIAAASKLISEGLSTAKSLVNRLTSPKTMTTTQITTIPQVRQIVNPKIIDVKPIPSPKPIPPKVIQKTNTTTVDKTLQNLSTSQQIVQQNITDLKNSSKLAMTTVQKQQITQQIAQQQLYSQALARAQRQLQQLKTQITPRTPLFKLAINPRLIIPPLFKKKKKGFSKIKTKSFLGYSVYVKSKNRFIKLKSNLTKDAARDYLAYALDNRLYRTGYVKAEGKTKKQTMIPTISKGYFSKASKKLRPYKIKSKTKIPIKGYIEKRKYILDTLGEKKQIQTKRKLTPTKRKELLERLKRAREARAKLNNRKVNKLKNTQTTKRKITPSKRRELLKRLEKARRVRMNNLKKKK